MDHIDIIDMTTSADGVVDSDRTITKASTTPTTPSKGLGDLNITTPQKPKAQHKPVSVEDPFHAPPSSSATAEPPLVRPTLINFTTPSKKAGDHVDLTETPTTVRTEKSASGLDNSKTPFHTPHSTMKKTSTSSLATPSKPTVQPTPLLITPQKPLTPLQASPPIASKYVPSYISPTSPVKVKDPKRLSIKPPFWKRWPVSRYKRLGAYLRETIDLVSFAEQEDITIEEAQHIFISLVVDPLYDETEKVGAVAEKRIETTFKTFKLKGEKMRTCTSADGEERVGGELAGVRPGVVQLTGEKGDYVEVRFKLLSREDQAHVRSLVSAEELMKLMRDD